MITTHKNSVFAAKNAELKLCRVSLYLANYPQSFGAEIIYNKQKLAVGGECGGSRRYGLCFYFCFVFCCNVRC